MPKIKYVGAHESYTVADIEFKKGESVNLADDQWAKVKANGIGARLFASGDLVVDGNKTVVNPDLTPAPKAAAKKDDDNKTAKK